jgi:hypothetical protein
MIQDPANRMSSATLKLKEAKQEERPYHKRLSGSKGRDEKGQSEQHDFKRLDSLSSMTLKGWTV